MGNRLWWGVSKPAKEVSNEVRRDFQPLIKFIKLAEINRGKQNEFDEPVIGNFAKYAITYGDILFAPELYEEAKIEARKTLFEMIAEALKIKVNEISDLDFKREPRDPRMCMMNLLLADGTEITVPLIDRSATEEE